MAIESSQNYQLTPKLKGYYTPHFHFKTQLFKILKDNWDSFLKVYPEKFEQRFGKLMDYQIIAIEKFLSCSNPHNGFSYVQCTNENCRQGYIVPFTCKSEKFAHRVRKSRCWSLQTG